MHWFFCLHEFVLKKFATLLICSSNSIHIFSLSFKESKKSKNDISSFSLKSLKDLFLFKHAGIVLKMNKYLSFQEFLDFLSHTWEGMGDEIYKSHGFFYICMYMLMLLGILQWI
jgi:hypothetical protein